MAAGSHAAVEVVLPASPPVPASLASTNPERQDTKIRAVIVLATALLGMALGPCKGA